MTPDSEMVDSYNAFLVFVSIAISILASYTALELARHLTGERGKPRVAWLMGGTMAMAIGIWSMHYVAMFAFSLPVPILYHWPTSLLSLLAAVASSALALFIVTRRQMRWPWIWVGGLFQGSGIASLHYLAMASMRMQAKDRYSPAIVTISVVIAIAGSALSLWLSFLFRHKTAEWQLRKVAGAVAMGAAISGMHYTAMAAVRFMATSQQPDFSHAMKVSYLGIAGMVSVGVMVSLSCVVLGLVERLQRGKALLDELFEQAPQGIALIDGDGRAVRVNREFTRLFGYAPAEAAGRPLNELIVPEDAQNQFQKRMESIAQGQRIDEEVVRRHKDGSQLHVLAISVPVSLPAGQIAAYAIYLDMTKRKETESALQTLSRRLLAVQETERRHLARELHDEIGQLLTSLFLLLKPNGEWPAGAIKTRFEQARATVNELLVKVRGLSFDLRPADLDQLGLLPALLAFFARLTEQTGLLVDFKHHGLDRRFAPEVETCAFRITQEALTNISRHAGVAGAIVRAWATADVLHLQIEDRGRGFDAEAAMRASRTQGIRGMHERAMLVGGHLTIESSPGSGTTIAAELPLRDRQRKAEGLRF